MPDRLLHCFAVLPPFPLVSVSVCCLAAWCVVLESAQRGGGRESNKVPISSNKK